MGETRLHVIVADPRVFGVLLCTAAVFAIIYRLYLHPLRQYPGPKLWAVSRLPWLRSTIRGTIVTDVRNLHERYGPVVRVAPNELSFATPEASKPIYSSLPEFRKDPMHLPPFHNGTPGILAADKEHHTRYRRLLASPFSDRGMRAQQALIRGHIDLLLRRLSEHCVSGPVDISEWFNWTTFDIIGDLAFGESFNCLENSRTHEWIASIQGNVKVIPIVNAIRRLHLGWIMPLLAPKKLMKMRQRNAEFTEEKVDRRLQRKGERGDLWDGITEADKPGTGMTRAEMVSNASAIVLAGSETTATLLSGCVWLLLQHPAVLQQLQTSVRDAFQHEEEIDLVTVGRLDYMMAVLDETLRLYPPVPMQSNRVVHSGGAMIAGGYVPAGTSVAVQQWAACRSEDNFHRANEFLPQRWMGDEEFAQDHRAASQPFSSGPRNCIGRQLAYAEMRLILAQILWRFDMELADERMRDKEWLLTQRVWILWEKDPLWVRLRPRSCTTPDSAIR